MLSQFEFSDFFEYFYPSKQKKYEKENIKRYDFGKTYNFADGDMDHSVLINELKIKYSYTDLLNKNKMNVTSEMMEMFLDQIEKMKKIKETSSS